VEPLILKTRITPLGDAVTMGACRNFSRGRQRYFAFLFQVVGDIGAGAGKFLWMRRNFAQISPNLPEKYSKENDLQENDCISFYVGCIFSNQNTSSTIFAQISLTCPKKN